MVAGLGFTAGTAALPSGYIVGDRDTGFYSSGANKIAFTAGGTESLEANTSGVNVSGILSATSISINGQAPLTALAKVGLGTPIDPSSTEGLDVVYYTDRSVALGGTITVPASADVAYTPYGDVVVNSGDELTISEGDQLLADVLGIGSLGTGQVSPGGVIRADQFTARMGNAPIFPSGLHAAGISTFTQDLNVLGDLNVTGDLSYDEVTGRNLNITGVSTFNELNVTGTANITGNTSFINVNASGITTSAGGFNIGIQSAGTSIATLINNLNFVGAGNTFLYHAGTRTIDIGIAGGGGGGGGGDAKTTFFASGYGGRTVSTK